MPNRIRAFIAIELPEAIKSVLEDFITELSGGKRDYKWVAPENLHITMAFLGDVDYDSLIAIGKAMETAVEGISAFPARLGPIGTFPSVIWVGLDEGNRECEAIYKKLKPALLNAGFRLDDKRYHPHITIARSRSRMDFSEKNAFECKILPQTNAFIIDGITLFESRLHPKGPEYSPLARVPLGGRKK